MAGYASPALFAVARWFGVAACIFCLSSSSARAADPAVAYMEKVARELLAASRSKSPALIASVIHRHADTGYIGSYSLGSYRNQLAAADRPGYLAGMVRFIGRYAANEAPKYPVATYRITGSVRGGQGIMVDSVISLRDGSSYDVRWLLVKRGTGYRVRDAMVYGFWMTPFLKKLFENYIAENGGHVRALVAVLSR
ncbi:MAG: ABC transporter substrate-binding protein [Hyphomicrobiaceae bacterium]